MPRRSSPAPMAASVSVLPRAGHEALSLVASTCRVLSVAWEYMYCVLSCFFCCV
jgi:uncharacterized Fe-S cluster-containing radical SAM superfamily enzyme